VICVSDRLLILTWHNVEPTWYQPQRPGAGARGLTHQLKRLRQLATVVPLTSALDALSNGEALPPRAVAITFDDGYRDNLDLAAPLLQELGLMATFFLIPGVLSREVDPWWERAAWAITNSQRPTVTWAERTLPTRGREGYRSILWAASHLKTLDRSHLQEALAELLGLLEPGGKPDLYELFLDWDGARRLAQQGFDIGSHTLHHMVLSRESHEEQVRDLASSRAELERELGMPIELVAYPSGTRDDYDARTIDAAEKAGYRFGLAAHAGIHSRGKPPYAVPRFVMVPDQGFSEILVRRVMGRLKVVVRR
jgi:peptidoglycan/xylan/chitin deacetylase (PgdA/CDA1 family)